jgi:hypothetical protein
MVQLEEVPDEELFAQQSGPKAEDEEEWDTSDGRHNTITIQATQADQPLQTPTYQT